MKVHEQCLPCMVSQAVKTANLTNANIREELYKKILHTCHLIYNITSLCFHFEEYRLNLCGYLCNIG